MKQLVYGSHACTTLAESAGVGDELYGYIRRLQFRFGEHPETATQDLPAEACLHGQVCGTRGGRPAVRFTKSVFKTSWIGQVCGTLTFAHR